MVIPLGIFDPFEEASKRRCRQPEETHPAHSPQRPHSRIRFSSQQDLRTDETELSLGRQRIRSVHR